MKTSVLAIVATMLIGSTAARAADVIMTGGELGDYYMYFAPPLQKILTKAWVDAPLQTSAGTPENLDFIAAHQTSYALVQGNIFADKAKDPKYAKVRQLPLVVGNEAVLAIVSPKMFERSHGSFTSIAQHAASVRFAVAPATSGPGATFLQIARMDPDGLGKATHLDAMPSLDAAIEAVARGDDDATLMVQFPNPSNPRFVKINELHLRFMGLVLPSMRALKLPDDKDAFSFCPDLEVGAKEAVSTACSPILVVTGAENVNSDLDRVLSSVTPADFAPKETGFAKFWKKMKTAGKVGWDAAASSANDLAKRASDSF